MALIHWYPGHMAKALRLLKDDVKWVDVVLELLDARLPSGSSNPVLAEVAGSKPRIIVLTKMDMADPAVTKLWMDHFKAQSINSISVDSAKGTGMKELLSLIKKCGEPVLANMDRKGLRRRSLRIVVAGIPNVGKSSVINRLVGGAATRTGDKAGVTRGKQWVKIASEIDLLDTPGLLAPRLDDQRAASFLAMSGAMNDDVYDVVEVAERFIVVLEELYPGRLAERYSIPQTNESAQEKLSTLARRCGCLGSGGVPLIQNVARILLNDFRKGKLGRISLEKPVLT